MPNTTVLKGYPIRKEAVAGGAITPGHLIAINSAGLAVVHPTAGGNTAPAYAYENEIFGKDLIGAYAAGDKVLYGVFSSGDEVYALVAAAASAIAVGDKLESAGNGTLRKLASGTAIATALEAVDNSAGGTAVRIVAEIL
jgi:hypothetical protein